MEWIWNRLELTPWAGTFLVGRQTVWRHRPPVATLGNCLAMPRFTLPSQQWFSPNRLKDCSHPCWAEPLREPFSQWLAGRGPVLRKPLWISYTCAPSWHVSNRLGTINLEQSFQTGSWLSEVTVVDKNCGVAYWHWECWAELEWFLEFYRKKKITSTVTGSGKERKCKYLAKQTLKKNLFSSFPRVGAEVQRGWGALWGRAAEVGAFHQGGQGHWVDRDSGSYCRPGF